MCASLEEIRLKGGEEVQKRKSFFLVHIFLAGIFVFLGIFAILASFGKTYFLPLGMFTTTFLEVLLLVIGLFFIREAVQNKGSGQRFVHLVVGLFLFFFALLPLFVSLGLLWFLPFYVELEVGPLILSLLLLFAGVYMAFDRFLLLSS